ncbi:MAG: serine--tRNA ligase [Nitrososphaerota archaeon]|jgi:seryl-tRNA synthetase|nr:serine--tRNA ligase [Nitrososphaerota archaeon]MDG6942208.1 serine--tRNA ligase [Nitrososphaerota archaeon]MDG6942673.1 serine--tRNA ligase [Nitrososphaerota archaeon]MDG6948460.1 serine--tRNA ligase [Nitrososphaerota archaeon]MDG6950386.1 serine--tRNA ligase [Nitrososphaerota archaeon]
MIDIKLVRDSPDAIVDSLRRRGAEGVIPLVREAAEADAEWRRLKTEVDRLRHRQNELTGEVAALKKKGAAIDDKLAEVKGIPQAIKDLDAKADERSARVTKILMSLPNILHSTVPFGTDETQSVTVRTWGDQPDLGFRPRDHIDILSGLGMVDMERGAKVAGARFFFLKGDAVKLEQSLMQYALDFLRGRGFTAVEPPLMMNRASYEGVVNLEDFGPVIYKIEGEDLHMIATSEHPLVSMHSDEILDASELPLKYSGFSPCFRVEAGAHGKDTKGIFRVHQFYKVEQVVFSKPQESWRIHEELIANAEEIYRRLGIPHRVVALCSGDTGFMSAKTYDLEAWLPGQGKYREMASASNITDFQSRRLGIRYRGKQSDPTALVHTLNSSAVVTRTLVAIVENFQQKDGTVKIPETLAPYMGGIDRLQRR